MKESSSNPKTYTCDCSPCKSARKRLKNLNKEESAISYHLQKILQEDLGQGNYWPTCSS